MRKLLLTIVVMFSLSANAWAVTETFYMCNGGKGTAPKIDPVENPYACAEAYDVSHFNNSDNWDTDVSVDGKIGPGDKIVMLDDGGSYASGEDIKFQQSGTRGNVITLEAEYGGSPKVVGARISLNGKSYITIDGIEIDGNGKETNCISYGVAGTSHVKIINSEVYSCVNKAVLASGSSYWTIGEIGAGNEFYNCGVDTAGADIAAGRIDGVAPNHLYIGYNKLYSNTSDYGVDGIMLESANAVVIEYNEIYDHKKIGSAEDGIDLKHQSHNIDIRKNYIRGHTGYSGLQIQSGSYDIRVYNNKFEANNQNIFLFPRYENECDIFNIKIWGNEIINGLSTGIYSTAQDDCKIHNIYIYNNTFAKNATQAKNPEHTHIRLRDVKQGATYVHIKNNIFYKGRPNENDYRQIYITDGVEEEIDLNYNIYHWPSHTSMVAWDSADRTISVLKSKYSTELFGLERNVRFNNADLDDFALASGSACIDSGANLGSLYDEALDPRRNFAFSPPRVITGDQDFYGTKWERGAYLYTGVEGITNPFRELSPRNLEISQDY